MSKLGAIELGAIEEVEARGLFDDIKAIFRMSEMQEFVDVVSSEELAQSTLTAQNVLNSISPVTSLTIEEMTTPSCYPILLEMVVYQSILRYILSSYTHKGIQATSIEDIQIEDRSTRYKEYLDSLNYEDIKDRCKRVKKAKGIGIDTESGKAESSSTNYHLNDFDCFGGGHTF